MSEFHGPKCQEMHFPAFQFPKIFRGSMPSDPSRNDGLKPILWVPQTQNRLLFTKFRLLKNLYTTLQTLPMFAEVFGADLSLKLEEKNSLSSRVCSTCGTKVRNCAPMLSQIKEKLNKPNPALTMALTVAVVYLNPGNSIR